MIDYLVRLLIFIALVAVSCQSVAPKTPTVKDNGLPVFQTPAEAVRFAVEEASFEQFRGGVWGSEYYEFTLPSGKLTNNWEINCYFNALFREFGTDAFDELAPLLMHEHEFVQVGAYSVLNSYMYKHGLRRYERQTEAERIATMERLVELLESQGV